LYTTESNFILGKEYVSGKLVKKNVKKGLEYLQTAASQGYAEAYLELGILYKEGKVVKKNTRKANNYFNDAVVLGCKEAELYLPAQKKK
jgi:TPR repeat protein